MVPFLARGKSACCLANHSARLARIGNHQKLAALAPNLIPTSPRGTCTRSCLNRNPLGLTITQWARAYLTNSVPTTPQGRRVQGSTVQGAAWSEAFGPCRRSGGEDTAKPPRTGFSGVHLGTGRRFSAIASRPSPAAGATVRLVLRQSSDDQRCPARVTGIQAYSVVSIFGQIQWA